MKLVPVGELSSWVPEELRGLLPAPFRERLSASLSSTLEVPARTRRRGEQYEASSFLSEVLRQREGRVLALTEVDLYSPGLNFVFGLAQYPGRGALVSLRRLDPRFYGGKWNKRLFLERLVKEATHELGHTLGLGHCRRGCVMSFSNSILEVDAKGGAFCPLCWGRLEASLRAEGG